MTDTHVNPEPAENFYDAMKNEATASRRLAAIRDIQARGTAVSDNAVDGAEKMVAKCRKATDATFRRLSVADQIEISARFRSLTPQEDFPSPDPN